jgi:Ca-activated chloride channel family protein
MHLNAHLDVDLIAVEQRDELALMLELTAPAAPGAAERAPATLEVVLDRSGSMGDGRLEAALTALDALVARLDPSDCFGLVVFDDEVDIVVPAGPLSDKQAVREALRRVHTGSSTNLSGGYLRGLHQQAQDAKRKASDALRAGDATGAARLYGRRARC